MGPLKSEPMAALNVKVGEEANDEHWFSLPEMGVVAATTFQLILITLSVDGSSTFVPIAGAPPTEPLCIVLGHVDKIHWVQVKLAEGHLFPKIVPLWDRNCESEASEWKEFLKDRMPIVNPPAAEPSMVHLKDTPINDLSSVAEIEVDNWKEGTADQMPIANSTVAEPPLVDLNDTSIKDLSSVFAEIETDNWKEGTADQMPIANCKFNGCRTTSVEDNVSSREEAEMTTEVNEKDHDDHDELEASHEDEEPKVGMTFNSEDEANRYYKNYARLMGFGVCKINSKNGDDGKKYITIGCSRARKYKNNSKNLLKPNPTTKTECKARLSACVSSDGTVVVSRVNLGHNHDLSPTKARFLRCNKNLEPRIKRRLELNDQVGINVSRNFRAFVVEANGYDNLTFGEKDCRNYIDKVRRLRLGTGDAQAIQNYFVRKQKQNSQFYYVMDVDDDSHLRNVFWADARSRIAYEYFGEVITFDTTYLTNKYDMPFAPFVGVNHHGHSMLLGCALLSNEDTQTFTWLFSRWLECMHGRAPNAIITDQDRAMKNAIEAVFPKARHRWCLWHIMKKVPEKLGRHSNYESIKKLLHGAVYDSFSRSDFMERWEKMIKDYELHDNDWLKGLFDERDRWVPVFLRDTFWAGMSTTQRSESMNSFFDGYVNSKTTLKQFVEQYDNALRDKIEKESLADFGSFNTEIACVSIFGFESQIQKAFTNAKFKEFQVEIASMMYCNTCFEKMDGLQSIYSVTETKKVFDKMKDIVFKISFNEEDCQFQCTCLLFEFRGILCRHILSVLKLTGITDSVPSCYVLSRWRKDIKRKHTLVKCGFDNLAGNTELQRLNKACDAFYEAASVGINTDDDLVTVMNWINSLKNELSCKETPPEMNTTPITDQDNSIQEEGTKILDPKVTRGRGRPPSKRKASKVDQIVNKKIATKKTQEGNQKSKNVQSQNKGSSTSSVHVNKNDGFIRSQIINEIGTQESIQDGQSCFLSGNGIINHLAPFNPNQNHIGQVPYYAQIVNRGIGYYELVQAQHHINNQPSSSRHDQP
ncbi:protein FAR1-RELATED SEQUENCE 6-like [Lotus japonicus]|uniref:protein FAR1-RELATED SEQUENCE 6-like n=1 Tax=Lotus japonicus TaxID=34305 RepID=UPI00258600F9|nr:protein FAR1-RELATED SEQUENCE 6-like [Lotus japonicus]